MSSEESDLKSEEKSPRYAKLHANIHPTTFSDTT